jgi:excisionase family DNA binding protein
MAEAPRPSYCTTREAAELLGVSLRTVQLWVERGVLDAWKTEGGHRRIVRESVFRLRDSQNRPISESPPANPPEPTSRSASNATSNDRLKVLVVEDDHILLRMYRVLLEKLPIPLTIITAPNAIEGLVLIGRESPDLLITDLLMPGLDGRTMVRTLCQSSLREALEIAIVTGLPPADLDAITGLPDDIRIFTKPVPFAELQKICEQLLLLRRKLQENTLTR